MILGGDGKPFIGLIHPSLEKRRRHIQGRGGRVKCINWLQMDRWDSFFFFFFEGVLSID